VLQDKKGEDDEEVEANIHLFLRKQTYLQGNNKQGDDPNVCKQQ